MRLKESEVTAIKETFKAYFRDGDSIWLFGSRVDYEARGGDIDLYVETKEQDPKNVFKAQIDFLVSLKSKIGDQKIDLVIKRPTLNLLIYREAKEKGIKLA